MGNKINYPQQIERLYHKIEKLKKENTEDLQEVVERGKELIKFADIVRSCGAMIQEGIRSKLMVIITEFEDRCEKTRRKHKH